MPHEEFRRMSYMVQFTYGMTELEINGRSTSGTLCINSTAASNRMAQAGDMKYWLAQEVFWIPGVYASQLLGNCWNGVSFGSASHFDAGASIYRTCEEYIQATRRFPMGAYRGWAGFSARYADESGRYHAVDLYTQPPDMFPSQKYHWCILRDIAEPVDWYKARSAWHCGDHTFAAYAGLPPHNRM